MIHHHHGDHTNTDKTVAAVQSSYIPWKGFFDLIAVADELRENSFTTPEDDVIFTMQHDPLGLGHAVLCAAKLALPGAVAVILPDDLILGAPGALTEMVQAYQSISSGHLIATMEVPEDEVSKYGILSITDRKGPIVIADSMVEKPSPADAPSR